MSMRDEGPPQGKYENWEINKRIGDARSQLEEKFGGMINPNMEEEGYIDIPLDRRNEELEWFFEQFPVDRSTGQRWDPITGPRGKMERGDWSKSPYSTDGYQGSEGSARIPLDEFRGYQDVGLERQMSSFEKSILESYHPDAKRLSTAEGSIGTMDLEGDLIKSMKTIDEKPIF